jgi:hypothetical protein
MFQRLNGTSKEGLGEIGCRREMRPRGLKPALIWEALRGAEAPLFHGAARIRAAHWFWPLVLAIGAGHWGWPLVLAIGSGHWGWPLGLPVGAARIGAACICGFFSNL